MFDFWIVTTKATGPKSSHDQLPWLQLWPHGWCAPSDHPGSVSVDGSFLSGAGGQFSGLATHWLLRTTHGDGARNQSGGHRITGRAGMRQGGEDTIEIYWTWLNIQHSWWSMFFYVCYAVFYVFPVVKSFSVPSTGPNRRQVPAVRSACHNASVQAKEAAGQSRRVWILLVRFT